MCERISVAEFAACNSGKNKSKRKIAFGIYGCAERRAICDAKEIYDGRRLCGCAFIVLAWMEANIIII